LDTGEWKDGFMTTADGHVIQLDTDSLSSRWPLPDGGDDKYSRGVVGVDTGSYRYPGAAVLSMLGALRAGAGFVRFCGAAAGEAVLARCPSVTFGPGRVQAWVLGCGWDEDADNMSRLASRLSDGCPCVLDAGALWVIDDVLVNLDWQVLPAGCLLTPHAGELARLMGVDRADVVADPIGWASQVAEKYGAAVLLKGATQYAVDGGRVEQAIPGPAWTAQAGSGDVLAGVAGTLLAAGVDAVEAGAMAASLQAMTAAKHLGPWAPDQLADWFPEVIGSF